jgi:hypothetical protein
MRSPAVVNYKVFFFGKKWTLGPRSKRAQRRRPPLPCAAHSGAKKAHDWAADQIADLFRTAHKVKTQQVARSRGQRCGDIELAAYLANCGGSGAFGAPNRPRTRLK